MTVRDAVKAALRPLLAPPLRYWRLRRAAAVLMRRARGITDHGRLFDLVMATPAFAALQHREEFLALLDRAAALAPRTVVEIGSFAGGTGFLLARAAAADARIVLVDDQFSAARRSALRRFAGPRQALTCLRGNSQTDAMRDRVVAAAGGAPVDVLFIDGDHRYEGVSRDFALYSPLVRPGGLIAFHDIVPVRRADAAADAGGVPVFWHELAQRFPATATAAIRDPRQDGCGIGMLYWRP